MARRHALYSSNQELCPNYIHFTPAQNSFNPNTELQVDQLRMLESFEACSTSGTTGYILVQTC